MVFFFFPHKRHDMNTPSPTSDNADEFFNDSWVNTINIINIITNIIICMSDCEEAAGTFQQHSKVSSIQIQVKMRPLTGFLSGASCSSTQVPAVHLQLGGSKSILYKCSRLMPGSQAVAECQFLLFSAKVVSLGIRKNLAFL